MSAKFATAGTIVAAAKLFPFYLPDVIQ